MQSPLTTEIFQRVLPKRFRGRVNQTVIDNINKTFTDPVLMEDYKDNLLSYTNVMQDGRFRMEQYIDAVRYVGFKLMDNTNIDSYIKTFPDRYASYLANGTSQKDIASYVTSYNKNKLVNLIYEQTFTPTSILNADLFQKALNKQASIMDNDDASFKVQSDAANSILTHIAAPVNNKLEIDLNLKQDSTLSDLRATTEMLVKRQREVLLAGEMSAQEIAQSDLLSGVVLEGEFTEE